MAKQGKAGKAGQPGKGPGKEAKESKLVTDSRFAAVHFDPRFQRFPKAKAKVEIDERFAGRTDVGCTVAAAALHRGFGEVVQLLACLAAHAGAAHTTTLAVRRRHAPSSRLLRCGCPPAGMFNDPSFQVKSAVDKRGRKVGGRGPGWHSTGMGKEGGGGVVKSAHRSVLQAGSWPYVDLTGRVSCGGPAICSLRGVSPARAP